jgi:hypothetical protein
MRASTPHAAPVWIKAMLFADEVVGSVCSDETMSRNQMTTGTELFAFAVREQVWAKTLSDGVEDLLIFGRECVHYGWHSWPDKKKASATGGSKSGNSWSTSRTSLIKLNPLIARSAVGILAMASQMREV